MNMKNKLLFFPFAFVLTQLHGQLIPISYNLNNKELVNIALLNTEKIKYPFSTRHEAMLMHRSQWTGLNKVQSGVDWHITYT